MATDWTPSSWKLHPSTQQAIYRDPEALQRVLCQIAGYPKIVTSWEVERLKDQLGQAARGERFLLQGGDCSERFADCVPHVVDAKLKILLMMGVVLMHGGDRRVVRVGRIAGQYAKPRSSPTETIGGVTLPSYRGDLVNRPEFTPEAREPDPQRLLEGFHRAAITINFIRGLLSGGFGSVHHPEAWDLSFVDHAAKPEEYLSVVRAMGDGVRFMETMLGRRLEELVSVEFFTSHEGLHLDFEQALCEQPPLREGWYNLGSHFPWIGERTRALDGAHVEFFRGIENPIGVKVGPSADPAEVVELCRVLDPDHEPGRLTLIHRMGVTRVQQVLPRLVEAVLRAGWCVTWCCDPMHGNTFSTAEGVKTRRFEDILLELERAFAVHEGLGSVLGGVHFELTGQDVTEVLGGARGMGEADLARAYETDVDPRLNYEQSLEMAFLIARHMRAVRERRRG
ncbi:MAG: 3-deoxy-7-phosphoheptulonate synthase class II [Pseudomonadota bacterium]